MSGVIEPIASLAVLAALAWVGAIVAAPLLPDALAGILYALGSRICHQISERSFHLGAAQLPVCARCFGIYTGFALGLVVARHSAPLCQMAGCSGWSLTPRRIAAIAALPTVITVAAEWAGLWPTSNLTRAVAGALLGVGVALVVLRAFVSRGAERAPGARRGGLHYDQCTPRPPIARDPPPSRT